MSLLGMVGKVAGSKIIGKVEDEITKKQNREQTIKYSSYISDNISRISQLITDLQIETKNFTDKILYSKDVKTSFKEKIELRKVKEKVSTNLKYLYLSRDFFTTLSKNASGIALTNEELALVIKFAPFFDGNPVLDMELQNVDDTVIGAFKEVGQELKSAFVASKKSFSFGEYLQRYDKKIKEYAMPDVDAAIESFKNTIVTQDAPTTDSPSVTIIEEIECPNCHIKITDISKFCPECGNKIEAIKTRFCTECGECLTSNSKFCANCGHKI